MAINWDTLSIREVFEQSSNVGMAKLIDRYYQGNSFSERLHDFHLDEELGLQISGEAQPYINNNSRSTWSLCSKAWMAIGYESRLTPLQMLNFYNAVANDGRMMQPYLVEKIVKEGKVLKAFKPTVIDEQVASRPTIEQLQLLLEGCCRTGDS
ncbi:MAG: hypothetical protein HC821_02655 [Lewinella sp.]|nr:hypothetical protein [Lewinella sp.]